MIFLIYDTNHMNYYLLQFINNTFKKPEKALDLGCGSGFDAACLKMLKWKVKNVDLKTGINLNSPYIGKEKVDLVYSNYVLQFIKNKEIFIDTCFNNLKNNGWLFLHTFSMKDKILKTKMSKREMENLLKNKFKNIKIREIRHYDNEHQHWHFILEATAQKSSLNF